MADNDDSNLEAFARTAALALDIPIEERWLPSICTNLKVTLLLASLVEEFNLPDESEPAPVFEA